MTHTELKKSHDAMARFLLSLCHSSDMAYGSRTEECEENYAKAVHLLKKAGFEYKAGRK